MHFIEETVEQYKQTGNLMLHEQILPTVDSLQRVDLAIRDINLDPPPLITQRAVDTRNTFNDAWSSGQLFIHAPTGLYVFKGCCFSNAQIGVDINVTVNFHSCRFQNCTLDHLHGGVDLASCTFQSCEFSGDGQSDTFTVGTVRTCQFIDCMLNGLQYTTNEDQSFQNNQFDRCQLLLFGPNWNTISPTELGRFLTENLHINNRFTRCFMPSPILVNFFGGSEFNSNISFGLTFHTAQEHEHLDLETFQTSDTSVEHATGLMHKKLNATLAHAIGSPQRLRKAIQTLTDEENGE